jgi:hypothetical protein
VQIWAAIIQNARTFLSTTTEGEGFCATAEGVYAMRTKEKEMVQELLKDWQKDLRLRKTLLSNWDVKILIA